MNYENIIEQLRNLRCSSLRQGARIRAYLYEALPLQEVEAFEEHLIDCEKCVKLIFLEEYLQGEETDLLSWASEVDDDKANGRAIAAAY